MVNFWRITTSELLVLLVIGISTPLIDHRVEATLFQFLFSSPDVTSFANRVADATSGPVFGDFLMTWEQYGAVLAAFLVRKPGAGTIAMSLNGLGQVFFNGTHTPHLLYGVTGVGADLVFVLFRFRRYDAGAVALAGLASQMFWYPFVYFTHGVYLYPSLFIVSDIIVRALGSTVGDGLFGAGLGVIILATARYSRRSITRLSQRVLASLPAERPRPKSIPRQFRA